MNTRKMFAGAGLLTLGILCWIDPILNLIRVIQNPITVDQFLAGIGTMPIGLLLFAVAYGGARGIGCVFCPFFAYVFITEGLEDA